jgi:regulator of protease activity HflC (stomatin/prohibitin superfamily)
MLRQVIGYTQAMLVFFIDRHTNKGQVKCMFSIKTVGDQEKAVLWYNKRFVRILNSGDYRLWNLAYRLTHLAFYQRLEGELAELLPNKFPKLMNEHFEVVSTTANQVGLVLHQGNIIAVVEPSERALFVRGFQPLAIQLLDVAGPVVLERGHVLIEARHKQWLNRYFQSVQPADGTVALLQRGGVPLGLVRSGEHVVLWRDGELPTVTVHNANESLPRATQEALLAANPPWLSEFLRLSVGANQVGLLRRGLSLAHIVPPNSEVMFANGLLRGEVLDIPIDVELDSQLVQEVRQTSLASQVEIALVPEYHLGALFINGRFIKTLAPGVHGFWKFGQSVQVAATDLRLKPIEVSGQEILSKDKVGLRLNLTANYRVIDPLLAWQHIHDIDGFVYKELQFALRAAIGNRNLDEILDDKTAIDTAIASAVSPQLEEFGLRLDGVGVKDIILPGEMRSILARVVEAEKTAQANIIRRREETAATRSLLNTAKVMEDNPVALRLKELETLEKLTEKIGSITVNNGLDGILTDLVRIKR